jgi:hypothetical protein
MTGDSTAAATFPDGLTYAFTVQPRARRVGEGDRGVAFQHPDSPGVGGLGGVVVVAAFENPSEVDQDGTAFGMVRTQEQLGDLERAAVSRFGHDALTPAEVDRGQVVQRHRDVAMHRPVVGLKGGQRFAENPFGGLDKPAAEQ